jgi:photosystem II stability/assembly factor-like uncharacterized protein
MGNDRAKDATGPTTQAGSGVDCSFSNGVRGYSTDLYVAKHNPFVWFHSLIDNQAYCDSHVVPLTALRPDLQRIDSTPNLSFISPNLANDGHDTPDSAVSGWDAYWVRQIMASPAYRQDGMIIIVYDENSDSGLVGAPVNGNILTSCCGEIAGPNSPSPGAFGSAGGGQTGAWIVTPYGTPGTLADTGIVTVTPSYNHYSMLRSLEDIFGITSGGADGQGHLGYAAGNGAPNASVGFRSFGCDDIFTTSCPPMGGQVPAPASPQPSTNVGPRRADGSALWLNPGPQGDELNGVSCAAASNCVAVGATGTILSSTDGGSSWTSPNSGTSSDLYAVSCPSFLVCVAVGASGAILKSSDGGQSWSAQASGTQQDLSGVSCPSASACYAVGAKGTIVSTSDGGANWSQQSSQTTQDLAQIACPGVSTCYVTGVFEIVPPTVVGGSPSTRGDILATSNGGQSWSSTAPVQFGVRYRGIACTALTSCVVGDETGNIYTTQDGFQSASSGSGIYTRIMGGSCGGGGNCVLVAELGAIVHTVNGTVVDQPNLPSGADLLSVSCPSASACYAVGRHGLIVTSTDGGAHWARSGADAAASNLRTNRGGNGWEGTTIGSLDLAATSCPTATACVAVGALGAILTSGNSGSSWSARGGLGAPGSDPFDLPLGQYDFSRYTPATIPESSDAHPLDAVSCSSTSSCVAVGELGKVMTTSNLDSGGGTWSPHSSNTANRLTGVSCPPASSTCFAAGDYGTILISTDSGQSWSPQASGTHSFLNGISCATPTSCVVVGSQGLVLTTNDGATWTPAPSSTQAYLAAVSCPSSASCVAVGASGIVLASGNGGRTWTLQNAPSGDDLDAVSCASASACFVSGSDGTVASTADGGQGWTLQGTGTTDALRGVSCPSQGSCFAVGDSGAILAVKTSPLGPPPVPETGLPMLLLLGALLLLGTVAVRHRRLASAETALAPGPGLNKRVVVGAPQVARAAKGHLS